MNVKAMNHLQLVVAVRFLTRRGEADTVRRDPVLAASVARDLALLTAELERRKQTSHTAA